MKKPIWSDPLFIFGIIGLAYEVVGCISQSIRSREEKAALMERIRLAREDGHPTTA